MKARLKYGAHLRELRLRAGLTQRALAERCGLTHVAVARIEADANGPNMGTLERFADVLGLSVRAMIPEEPMRCRRTRAAAEPSGAPDVACEVAS